MSGPTRREFLTTLAVAPLLPAMGNDEPLISANDLRFLRDLARSTIASATRQESVPHLGYPVVTPGGQYPAYWIRDFSMAAGCGLVSDEILLNHLLLTAKAQNGPAERRLGDRAVIPPYAVPDHVNYDGGAVFYPGTYSSGDDQGGEPWGVLPPTDDHYEFVHLAYLYWRRTKKVDFLAESTLFDRLQRAFDVPAVAPRTSLVRTDAKRRAVGFGFCDGIYFTGSLLFPSLLRYRALGELIELATALRTPGRVPEWRAERNRIEQNLIPTFRHTGWLKAATEVGGQPDVWGTIYALYLGVVKGDDRRRLRETVRDAVQRGTIAYRGAVRHVPTDHDFSATSAWERTAGEAINRYQNGAYWHVPSGWLAKVLWPVDRPLARSVVRDMIDHLRTEDYRSGGGAPWECLHPGRRLPTEPGLHGFRDPAARSADRLE